MLSIAGVVIFEVITRKICLYDIERVYNYTDRYDYDRKSITISFESSDDEILISSNLENGSEGIVYCIKNVENELIDESVVKNFE